jgi:hypothetical protein
MNETPPPNCRHGHDGAQLQPLEFYHLLRSLQRRIVEKGIKAAWNLTQSQDLRVDFGPFAEDLGLDKKSSVHERRCQYYITMQ